ncbi:MAG: endonuclease/exonuclease/phosphatase family protein [Actinomycetales bacterium]
MTTADDDTHRAWVGPVGWLCLAVAALFGALTAIRWIPDDGTFVVAAASGRWLWGLGTFATLVMAGLLGHRPAVLGCSLLAAAQLALGTTWPAPASAPPPGPDQVTVLAVNLEYGQADQHVLADISTRLDVDVLVLTEVTAQSLEAAVANPRFTHHVGRASQDASGTVVLSRWPLRPVEPGRSTTFDMPLVDVDTPRGTVRVRAVHNASPLHPGWQRELAELAQKPADDMPTVLAGDFNASRDHAAFRPLLASYDDAFDLVGGGWVPTWSTRAIPYVRIDHLMVHRLAVVDAGTVRLPDTDHAGVWARLEPSGVAQ